MRCRNLRTVGFQPDGRTIAWSQKTYSKEYPTFQLPCGKCIACRLEYGRQWAVRATHEAKIHPQNSFVTLTYAEPLLASPKLNYDHFQTFMQDLRDHIRSDSRALKQEPPEIGFMACGEYGEKFKRPHFHACIFGWSPNDAKYKYTTDNGDKVYTSTLLGPADASEVSDGKNRLWNYGIAEFGSVTFQSAGYVARYAAKKLVHGSDQDHDYHPIFKTSRKYAIGKRWLEKYWQDAFNNGQIILLKPDGTTVKCGIPRYYEKWLRENRIDDYIRYLQRIKYPRNQQMEKKSHEDLIRHLNLNWDNGATLTRAETEHKVLEQKFKQQLQNKLKL